MTNPSPTRYADTPLDLKGKPTLKNALLHAVGNGGVLPPTLGDGQLPWFQRDTNELLDRGMVRRHRQCAISKNWSYVLTRAGTDIALSLATKKGFK
jgi:hypothetical protein